MEHWGSRGGKKGSQKTPLDGRAAAQSAPKARSLSLGPCALLQTHKEIPSPLDEKGNSIFFLLQDHHSRCSTDAAKLQLLHLWEDSLYKNFAESRSLGGGDPSALSSSMRYKLRKKHPCPVELEHEMRVKNARLPKQVHDGLNSWLKKHRDNPYPNKAEKETLSAKLGITPQQVGMHPSFLTVHSLTYIRDRKIPSGACTMTLCSHEEQEGGHNVVV